MKILDQKIFTKLAHAYHEQPENVVIANAISNVGVKDATLNKYVVNKHDFIFSNEVNTNEVTAQKKTGRCWMFAGLNMIRYRIAKELKMDNFELSETYLYFYDNMEKTNHFLQMVIDTKDKDLLSRDVESVFHEEPGDGGYYEFFIYLVKKYGLVPKTVMADSFHANDSDAMFRMLEKPLKNIALQIRKEKDIAKIEELREKGLQLAYTVFANCLGEPVQEFTFKYYDKDKKFHCVEKMTPQAFAHQYVGDFFNDKVKLINDPRHEYGRVLIDKRAKNATDLPDLEGINVDMDTMSLVAQKAIENGETMWFACDVVENYDRQSGILDQDLYRIDHQDFGKMAFDKESRINARYSYPCHAMNLTGFNKQKDHVNFWKVENSWGDEIGKKGFFSMSDEWFRDNNFELIVDQKFLPEGLYEKAYNLDKIVYDPYDPLCLAFKKLK